MKQVLFLFRENWRCCLALHLMFLVWITDGWSQGLFKLYDQSQSGLLGKHIRELPDGDYRLVADNNISFYGSPALRHLILDISPAGEIIDSQTVTFSGYRGFWLKDGTFLQPERDWANGDSTFLFIRTNAQQDTLWATTVWVEPENFDVIWTNADLDSIGNVWVAGLWVNATSNGDQTKLLLLKFTSDGNLLWEKSLPPSQPDRFIEEPTIKLGITTNNHCILKQMLDNGITQVMRFDANGEIEWQQDIPFTSYAYHDMQVGKDDQSLILGVSKLLAVNSSGAIAFQPFTGSLVSGEITAMAPIEEGGWVLMGRMNGTGNLFALKINESGVKQWLKVYNFQAGTPFKGDETANKDLIWTGGGVFLIRMDSSGVIFKNHLAGRIAYDENTDCVVQNDESGIPGWVLKLENNGAVQYTVSDPDGAYYFAQADTGQQILTPVVQNYLWQGCAPSITGTIPPDSSGYTLQLDGAIQSVFDCPVMTVDLATPRLRRCFNNTYALQCCNYGNQAATGAYVEVYLPPHLLLQSASHAYTQDGQKVTFPLGAVGPFECIDIQMGVLPDCDSTVLGEALCVSAHIWPDTTCGVPPGWSGALIEVSAACDGDSVRFDIQNTGNAPTSQPLDFIVIDDHVMTLQGSFSLAAHATRTESVPADGSTWRLLAEQEPDAPGASMPSIAVEGCVAEAGNPFNTGFILQWPNENGSPFWERDCHELVGSYDPNAKHAAPAGVNDPHWIKPNTPIEYLIEFQNTGTDTAFTVVLRDTLSPWLDPASIRPGAGSHPYSWDISGTGVLSFRFDPVALPDSNTNEPASHGFVQFWVKQYPDLPDGTLLENRAGIYFDFNAPVITNTVYHTVGRDFLPTVGINNPTDSTSPDFDVYPNPAEGSVFVFFKNDNQRGGVFTLFDALGRLKWTGKTNGKSVEIRRGNLPPGLYWLRWEDEDGQMQVVKVVWQ